MAEKIIQIHQKPIYQLKITLRDSRPSIWRRIEIPSDISLIQLHFVIQLTMGWDNYHLWEFVKGKIHYSDLQSEEDMDNFGEKVIDAAKVLLSDLLDREKDKLTYWYDFGDDWMHDIVLEKKVNPEPGVSYPRCVAGKMATPPEDCGGMGGYVHMLECLNDPDHEERESLVEWLGGEFDPNLFNIDEVNKRLNAINSDLSPQFEKWLQKENKRRKPRTHNEWLIEIVEAYQEALDNQSIVDTIDIPVTDDNLFHMAPYICMQFRGIKANEKNITKIVEGALASYVATLEIEGGEILEESPLFAFCFCYLASHYAADLLKEEKVHSLMDMCVKRYEVLLNAIENHGE